MYGAARTIFGTLNDLLFPPLCLGCQQRLGSSHPPLLCPECSKKLIFIRSPLCSLCGTPFPKGADHLCGDCLAGRYSFDLARSLCQYCPPISDLILALKFHGRLTGIATFRTLLDQSALFEIFTTPDIILPVPLHKKRLRQRGFNQAQLITSGCFLQWRKKIVLNLLTRHRPTTPQAVLSGSKRRRNVHNVFSLSRPDLVAGARVLLVDDVYTTGSTINACSKILRKAGAERIEVFTLARSLAS
ncbi:MAG: ComF family protein [Desulfobulbus oligotrophicus]|nr:ComF family protein [Desulfobulbus oligotrophicus]